MAPMAMAGRIHSGAVDFTPKKSAQNPAKATARIAKVPTRMMRNLHHEYRKAANGP